MDKKTIQKELVTICRKWFNNHNLGAGRVKPYQDISVECKVYGNSKLGGYLKEYLRQFPEFHEIGFDLLWRKDGHEIYITIV